MKNTFAALIVALFLPLVSFSQLRLQQMEGKRTATFPIGKEIKLKIPTTPKGDKCECSNSFKGILKSVNGDSAKLVLNESILIYQDADMVAKKDIKLYKYLSKQIETPIPLIDLSYISIERKHRPHFGMALILLSVFDGLFVGPLLSEKERKVNDKIVVAGFSAGLTLALLPKKKTYYLQNPKGKKRRLWKIIN